MQNPICIFYLVSGHTITGRLLTSPERVLEEGHYEIEKPLRIEAVPTQGGGVQVMPMPYGGMLGLVSQPESVNIALMHVIGNPIAADDHVEKLWLQSSSGIQLAK